MNSLDVLYMEMCLVFINKNNLTMRYFNIVVILLVIGLFNSVILIFKKYFELTKIAIALDALNVKLN
jgi:hypothetical protein